MRTTLKTSASLLLCLAMLFNLLPAVVFAAPGSGLSDSVTDSADNDGVSLSKSVSYDPATGKVTTVIEAYTTGTVTSSDTTKPTDIVLVLDVSGSMADSFGDSTGMAAMKTAVNSFIAETAAKNNAIADASKRHAIAIVKFASDYKTNSNDLTPGNDTYSSDGNEYNYTQVLSSFTAPTGDGSALTGQVNNLKAGGATAVDRGLTLASGLLSARASEGGGQYAEREKVVIVFTDGSPTHSNGYSSRVAYNAVTASLAIKTTGATVYTVGIFSGANPSDLSSNNNKFMNYVSGNYPKAYGSTETEYFLGFPIGTITTSMPAKSLTPPAITWPPPILPR